MRADYTCDDLFQAISARVRQHAMHLNRADEQFQIIPSEGRGGAYPERAITYFFIQALREAIDGTVILETPFQNQVTSKHEFHLDAVVFNDDLVILAEFKTAGAPAHWDLLAADFNRVNAFAKVIDTRFRVAKPRRLFEFYGVDAWRERIAEVWLTGNPSHGWKLPDVFREMNRGIERVWTKKAADFDSYHLLFALKEIKVQLSSPPC